MKRILTILAACILLLASLACAKAPAAEPETAPAVTVPETLELSLTLPLGARDDVARTLPAYTDGFSAKDDVPLRFSVVSSDPGVAEGMLAANGTLYVIAHGVGETKLTVTAKTASGEQNAATVSVKVRDARRTLVLIVLGVLCVTLLVLLGRPAAKKPAPEEPASPEETPDPVAIFEDPEEPASPEEAPDPVVIFEESEEPNDNPERS